MVLHLLVIIIDASSQGARISALFLRQGRGLLDVLVSRSVQLFLEDRVGICGLELGLEVT